MDNWTYFNPVRVVSAPGAVSQLADYVHFRRVVLVTSPGFTRRGITARIRGSLGERLLAVLDDVKPNPDVQDIDAQAAQIRKFDPDCLVALGGGSSMDTAKALARLLTQPVSTTLAAHFRDGSVLGEHVALPVITLPTTSGTGSEVTPFGTVWDLEKKKKYSVTGGDLYSNTAILDPELTVSLPQDVTISSGLDAISHALESVWNRHANPVTLGFATASLRLSLQALPVLKTRPDDLCMRGAMMQASLLAGLAISQTRTALAHSISYPLTTAFGLPHGIACSFTLPALMCFNAKADDAGRLQNLARVLGYGSIDAFAEGLREIFRDLDVAGLFFRHVPDADAVMALADKMFTPSRAGNNIRHAHVQDVESILQSALQQLSNGYETFD